VERTDIQTRTLYAELLEQMQILEASRTIADLRGSFSTKTVKGETYVYFQHYIPGGKLNQVYVGKLNEQTEALMHEYAQGKIETEKMRESIIRLSLQIKAGCDIPIDAAMTRVISSMAEAGFFRYGGVLIGTHAYLALGVMLGAHWVRASMSTSDIDLAANRHVAIAVPKLKADIPATIDSLKMGFYPVPAMNLKHPSTTFAIRKSRLRLDILTPKTSDSDAPVYIPRFNCAATPLQYLGYLIEEPIPAILLGTEPVMARVPHPVRYALHKLIVSQLREITSATKKEKDLLQAHQLLTILNEERPDDVSKAWEDIISRGPKWKKLVEAGNSDMERRFGKLEEVNV
jgi:hypothetical protein